LSLSRFRTSSGSLAIFAAIRRTYWGCLLASFLYR